MTILALTIMSNVIRNKLSNVSGRTLKSWDLIWLLRPPLKVFLESGIKVTHYQFEYPVLKVLHCSAMPQRQICSESFGEEHYSGTRLDGIRWIFHQRCRFLITNVIGGI